MTDGHLETTACRSPRLDVIVPTHDREQLLERTLESLLAAEIPAGLDVRVTVVDNDSADGTRALVARHVERFHGRLGYLFEPRPGRSNALNAGIAATSGELVGMIDDDEEIDARWYARIACAFQDASVDFIGGPYIPRWGGELPEWLPRDYPAVVGWVEPASDALVYGADSSLILMGGNAVLRRSVLEGVGPYSTALGRRGKRLLSCEDEDMFRRLLAAGARGKYLPDLVVYHYVPPERLTKAYHRSWCFWHGVSKAILERGQRQPVTYVAGLPRYLVGRAARGMLRRVRGIVAGGVDPASAFADELATWDLLGFCYGKYFGRLALA